MRDTDTRLVVCMLTTAGAAADTAAEYEFGAGEARLSGLRNNPVATLFGLLSCGLTPNQSGRSVVTTNKTAIHTVTA